MEVAHDKILAAGVSQLEGAGGEQLQLVQRLDQLSGALHFNGEVLQELDHLVQIGGVFAVCGEQLTAFFLIPAAVGGGEADGEIISVVLCQDEGVTPYERGGVGACLRRAALVQVPVLPYCEPQQRDRHQLIVLPDERDRVVPCGLKEFPTCQRYQMGLCGEGAILRKPDLEDLVRIAVK